jgi:hypothetical protein
LAEVTILATREKSKLGMSSEYSNFILRMKLRSGEDQFRSTRWFGTTVFVYPTKCSIAAVADADYLMTIHRAIETPKLRA